MTSPPRATEWALPVGDELSPSEHLDPRKPIPIAETFTSIQGEGTLTGTPSFFIRVSGCNLRCSWCDTPYASWSPEGGPRSIESLVEDARESSAQHVVITGGEPMIFPQMTALTESLRAAGLHITIETAGTRALPVACDLMSISPKLANSTPEGLLGEKHESRRLDLAVLQSLLDIHPERQLKFVVTGERDFPEIDALLGELSGWSAGDIQLMPEGVESPPEALRQLVAGACLERGWRYCHRLHIELFGNTRGT